jgi:hypothetical protein
LDILLENVVRRKERAKERQAKAKERQKVTRVRAFGLQGKTVERLRKDSVEAQPKEMVGKGAKPKGKDSVANAGIVERKVTGRMSARSRDRRWRLGAWRRSKS